MNPAFCPGYTQSPFKSLARNYPGDDIYPADDFRTEWGPVFHRGRLNGSARVLVIGQDPAQSEVVARRILVGTAGKRVQGFLHKLGITRSYTILNTFLYGVYGQQGGNAHVGDAAIAAYRNAWIAGVFKHSPIEAVIAFGSLADKAWKDWLKAPAAAGLAAVHYEHVLHPTSPTAGGASSSEAATATAAMLAKYNAAIARIRAALTTADATPDALYGNDFTSADLPPIPLEDLPAGTPGWMASAENWAARSGTTAALKRRTIEVLVPDGVIA